ncbi:MAG: ATP-binding protein [Lachnospiraceae bacterium]
MNKENRKRELTIEAAGKNLEKVTSFVDEELEKLDCPMKIQAQINIAVDELFSNIAHYAYAPRTGPAVVMVEVKESPLEVVITFIDRGIPYNPLKTEEPDVTLSAEDREEGGLGIFLVKRIMDDVTYEYRDGQNILSIRKKLGSWEDSRPGL